MNENFVGQETTNVDTPDDMMTNGFINTLKANIDDRDTKASKLMQISKNLEGWYVGLACIGTSLAAC